MSDRLRNEFNVRRWPWNPASSPAVLSTEHSREHSLNFAREELDPRANAHTPVKGPRMRETKGKQLHTCAAQRTPSSSPLSPAGPKYPLYSYTFHYFYFSIPTCLVDVITKELSERGLTTPLLFSNQALDISRTRIHRSYLHQTNSSVDMKWCKEARFTGLHELSMTLRWGLARIVRIHGGQETHGILAWEH
ncbi:hypothetical protein M422DRAFT_248088 [Sphaerobolus stellatus SS14]|nr:hypothetical protein M422DRAFT_248088 [Sphaerobolus stellatus SS14]